MTKMAAAAARNAQSAERLGKRGDFVSLENIIQQCVQTKASWGLKQNDMAFALAFWSMVECGFRSVLRGEARKATEKSEEVLPKDWKHETRQVYEAHFFLPPYANHPVKLLAFPAGDVLCINVLACNVSPKNINLKSLAIYTPTYVPRPEDDPPSCKFSGLSDFQLLLRNGVIWPIRCSILTDQGVLNGSLCGLSDEIKLKIVRHLSVTELLVLGQTCHDLNRICNDQSLWKEVFHRDFRRLCRCAAAAEECEEDADWKEHFKKAHAQKRSGGSARSSPSGSYRTPPDGPFENEIDFDID